MTSKQFEKAIDNLLKLNPTSKVEYYENLKRKYTSRSNSMVKNGQHSRTTKSQQYKQQT